MNIDKLTEIAEWLDAGAPERKGVKGFDMADFILQGDCGTTCCIGGAAIQFNEDRTYKTRQEFYRVNGWNKGAISDYAASLLGLNETQQNKLFYPYDETDAFPPLNQYIAPSWAARCIRKLIDTGRVDWIGTYVPLPLQP